MLRFLKKKRVEKRKKKKGWFSMRAHTGRQGSVRLLLPRSIIRNSSLPIFAAAAAARSLPFHLTQSIRDIIITRRRRRSSLSSAMMMMHTIQPRSEGRERERERCIYAWISSTDLFTLRILLINRRKKIRRLMIQRLT